MMGSHLPEAFINKMKQLLGPEFPGFLASYDDPRWYGLRVNTLKIPVDAFLRISDFTLTPIPWTDTGFYYEEEDRPGKHPHYHAGLYYIQEPSAMAPAELLDVKPGDRVLDLCAAPGGKSTQIAAKLAGTGVLVVNDIHADRVKALVKNLELAGVRNAVVLNERPDKLERPFAGYFDKILIDAPCSGEGMFRKEEDMAKQWKPGDAGRYAAMQAELLRQAAVMLKPGGRLVYSTCTFSPEENEAVIAEFINSHPHFEVEPIPAHHGFRHGQPGWVAFQADVSGLTEKAVQAVGGTVRLWPNYLRGEGHFVAALRKAAEPERLEERVAVGGGVIRTKRPNVRDKMSREKGKQAVDLEPLYAFWRELVELPLPLRVTAFGEHLYESPAELPDLNGIRVIRPGWYLGSIRKQRFEPSHALAMGLARAEFARTVSLQADSTEAIRYLKGETLELPADRIQCITKAGRKGYCLVCIQEFPVGWGKWADGMLKNEYPPGWRWT
jgi:NOL1/NOP2/sun family putative RNA methylase